MWFAASHPYLIGCQASLNDLNSRLLEPVGFEAFRPNLTIKSHETARPYEEVRYLPLVETRGLFGVCLTLTSRFADIEGRLERCGNRELYPYVQ